MTASSPGAPRRQVSSWVLYDLANTIFAFAVIGLYFPTWLEHMDLADSVLAGVQMAAAAVVVFLGPWSGARTDATGRRLPTLIFTTLVAVAATGLLGTGPVALTVALLWLAVVAVNTGSVVYDAMLGDIVTPEKRGWVSGVGVGVGYFGSFIGLGLGYLTFEVLDLGYAATFRVLALGFLVFALPTFIFIRETGTGSGGPVPGVRTVIARLIASWRLATHHEGVVRFLVGRFFYTDAINTLIGGFLTLFVIRELGFTQNQINLLLLSAIAAAVVGGLGAGRIMRRVAPLTLLRFVLVVWMVALASGIVANVTGWHVIAWFIGPLGGLALGSTWSADRVVMLRISPPQHLGEFYGLYGTVGRFATIFGPLIWALIVDGLGLSRNWAMGSLAAFVAIGLWILRKVDDTPRVWIPEAGISEIPDPGRT